MPPCRCLDRSIDRPVRSYTCDDLSLLFLFVCVRVVVIVKRNRRETRYDDPLYVQEDANVKRDEHMRQCIPNEMRPACFTRLESVRRGDNSRPGHYIRSVCTLRFPRQYGRIMTLSHIYVRVRALPPSLPPSLSFSPLPAYV